MVDLSEGSRRVQHHPKGPGPSVAQATTSLRFRTYEILCSTIPATDGPGHSLVHPPKDEDQDRFTRARGKKLHSSESGAPATMATLGASHKRHTFSNAHARGTRRPCGLNWPLPACGRGPLPVVVNMLEPPCTIRPSGCPGWTTLLSEMSRLAQTGWSR